MSVLGDLCEDVEPGDFRDVLCFGSVAVGATVERHVEICNPSMVSWQGGCKSVFLPDLSS